MVLQRLTIYRHLEHLNVLETDLADRNVLIKASQDEIRRLREENDERESTILMHLHPALTLLTSC